jgi:predicted nicotinamide N-methyase
MDDVARRRFILEHTSLGPTPFVPEIRLWMGGEAMPLWEAAALADERLPVPPPYWAWPWAGGQILARHVLDHPELVSGQRVADVGSGGGIVAIAAALAGAARVEAIDIEPYAIAACALNATANGVDVAVREADPIGRDDGWDVVLAGDVWYEAELADRMAPWLRALAGRGALVLTGDLGRAYLPADGLVEVARAEVPTLVDLEDVPRKLARVLRLTDPGASTAGAATPAGASDPAGDRPS